MFCIDLNNDFLEDIEVYFVSMFVIEYEVNELVKFVLIVSELVDIFNFFNVFQDFMLEKIVEGMSLVWIGVSDVIYNVYCIMLFGSNYQLVVEGLEVEMYLDMIIVEGVMYYYIVIVDNGEESYVFNEVVIEIFYVSILGLIEVEYFSGQLGFQVEDIQDEGGGQNFGYIDFGDILIYNVEVVEVGEYIVLLCIVSLGGFEGIVFSMNGINVGSILVFDMGDW